MLVPTHRSWACGRVKVPSTLGDLPSEPTLRGSSDSHRCCQQHWGLLLSRPRQDQEQLQVGDSRETLGCALRMARGPHPSRVEDSGGLILLFGLGPCLLPELQDKKNGPERPAEHSSLLSPPQSLGSLTPGPWGGWRLSVTILTPLVYSKPPFEGAEVLVSWQGAGQGVHTCGFSGTCSVNTAWLAQD